MKEPDDKLKKIIEKHLAEPVQHSPSADQLRLYLNGHLSTKDQHKLEEQLLNDSLGTESLEGLVNIQPPNRLIQIELEINAKLHKRLNKRPSLLLKQNTTNWAVAATLLLLAVSTYLTVHILQQNTKSAGDTAQETLQESPTMAYEKVVSEAQRAKSMPSAPTSDMATVTQKTTLATDNLTLNNKPQKEATSSVTHTRSRNLSNLSLELENKNRGVSQETTDKAKADEASAKTNAGAEPTPEESIVPVTANTEAADEEADNYADNKTSAEDASAGNSVPLKKNMERKSKEVEVSQTQQDNLKSRLDEANKLFEQERYQKALKLINSLKVAPKTELYPEFLWLKANTLVKLKRNNEAKKELAILKTVPSYRLQAETLLKSLK
ncbi:MAG: hypothetical protein EAZ57_09280 [Cytophagales bacterium]|nr:MAG: hypothetical protein EAZ67_10085 [Cytophagales bacterium]TAF59958.1 MAG: hypothetical protein EAZ57_09280 [Cytophagales bacterium]